MKTKYKFSPLFISALLLFAACNKNLDVAPESSYYTGDFYKTVNDFRQALYGVYGSLRAINGLQYPLMMESLSDNISTSTNNPQTRLTFSSEDDNVRQVWANYWAVISRSNAILDQIDQGEFSSEDDRNHLKGETLFLRAYAYFQLGWLFGGMPLIDKSMSPEEITQVPRSTQQETFDFAANDFTQAASMMVEEQAAVNFGRATKYAAEGLLARLYVFTKNYEAAKPLLEDIIASEKYAPYPSYQDCFVNTKDNGSEHVFQIQYTTGLTNQGNELVYSLVPENMRSDLFPSGGRSLWLAVSTDLYGSYETDDQRRDITIQKGYNTNNNIIDTSTLLYIKYAHGDVPANNYDNDVNISILRYTDVQLMYAEVLNELGYEAGGEAFTLINGVRSRAGLLPLEASDAPDQASFREALFQERRVEFAGESLRWFDIVRQGPDVASGIMTTFLNRPAEGSGQYKFDPKFLLLPIPNAELLTNPALKQNPGY